MRLKGVINVSLKNIELQVALPKTHDIGKLQNQMHQRANIDQALQTAQMKELEIKKRKQTEKLSKSKLTEQNTTRTPKERRAKEPNKGSFIDLEL